MAHFRIKEIYAKPDYMLEAVFIDNVRKSYDVKKWIEKNEAFKPLKYVKGLFELVKIDCGGFGVAWNSEIDLDANEIWYNGQEI